MDPFRSHQRCQKVILLTGCILSCLLQLVPAQQSLTVIAYPQHPKEGENVLLSVLSVPERFVKCEWMQPSGTKITFSPQENSGSKTSRTDTAQTVTVHQNCTLDIENLTLSARGNYTVTITTRSTKTQDSKDQTVEEIYIGSILLNVSAIINIPVKLKPPTFHSGQNVTLVPEYSPPIFSVCKWTQIDASGVVKEFQYSKSEPGKRQRQLPKTIQEDCSLLITQITKDDFGDYIVDIEDFSEQDSKTGKGTRMEPRFYRGQVKLQVQKKPEQGAHNDSTSLKYSAGIILGALFGSLTWTNRFPLFSKLF